MTPEDLEARLLYRDADVLVLDKPAGLAVHPAPGVGASLEPLLPSLSFGLKWPPALAHRLDRDTSGCLVLGRHPQALRALMRLFAERGVEKSYWAVVEGAPPAESGDAADPLLKVHRGRAWRMIADPAGQSALTHWRLFGGDGARSWLELTPETGRMHQLRVHCAGFGCPVVGDPLYGVRAGLGERLHLHARRIRLQLAPKRPVIDVAAAPPAHMLPALKACGYEMEA
ncbi:MAG TPA: RNA pseudouridine synthase [Aliidongia sp.]|nr:RNA pseudouridine synthase [Aliidongia sp.]